MSTRSDAYKILSLWGAFNAGTRGPGAVFRYFARRYAHRTLARTMRRGGL